MPFPAFGDHIKCEIVLDNLVEFKTLSESWEPKNHRLMLGCAKGKKSPRYHRKTTKDHAKKASEVGKTLCPFT